MSNKYSEKAHPSLIYNRFNTRYVIHLFNYIDTLFEWSQMKIIKIEFPIFWYKTFFMFKTSLLLLNFCLCVYIVHLLPNDLLTVTICSHLYQCACLHKLTCVVQWLYNWQLDHPEHTSRFFIVHNRCVPDVIWDTSKEG